MKHTTENLAALGFLLMFTSGALGVRTLAVCSVESCVLLTECLPLWCLLRSNAPHRRANVTRAICGFSGPRAKVCCPANPDAEVSSRLNTTKERTRLRREMCEQRSSSRSSLLPDSCGQPSSNDRIVRGTSAGLGQYPWMVAIYYKHHIKGVRKFLCGGSLISRRYVLTAAHCVVQSHLRDWEMTHVVLGDWRLSTDPDCIDNICVDERLTLLAEEIVVHPRFGNNSLLDHDIALIRLQRDVNFTMFIRPICLPPTRFERSEISLNRTVIAIGWGSTKSVDYSDVLQEASLRIANPFVCKRIFPQYFHINGVQMCIGGGQEDTCSGDSGGPVMKLNKDLRYYVLAVTSFGIENNCGVNDHPAVYTSVAHFNTWIRQSIKP